MTGKDPFSPEYRLPIKRKNIAFYEELFGRVEFRIAIKAGVAASLSFLVGTRFAYYFDRPDFLVSGTWSVLSTFVVMQSNLGGTYRAAGVRFLGVLIGSFMGGLFTSIMGTNTLSLGISVILTILILSLLNLKDSLRISCFSLAVVMILSGTHGSLSPWKFGMYRFLDSTLGILIAVLVSHTLWPSKATDKMRHNMATALTYLNRLLKLELSLEPKHQNYDKVYAKLTRDTLFLLSETRQYLQESELELLTKSRSLDSWELLVSFLDALFQKTGQLHTFQKGSVKKILDEELQKELALTVEACSKTLIDLSEMLETSAIKDESENLPAAFNRLNEELTRFRISRSTRKFERDDVEHFFVFFYNLRSLVEELLKMKEKVVDFNTKSQ